MVSGRCENSYSGVISGIGVYLPHARPTGYRTRQVSVPLLMKITFMMDRHDTIGIDCVAMCVNDIACMGAKPNFS